MHVDIQQRDFTTTMRTNMRLAAISAVPNLDTSNWNCDSSVLDPIQAAIAAKDNVLETIPEGTFLDDDDFAAMYPH